MKAKKLAGGERESEMSWRRTAEDGTVACTG